MDEDTLTQAAIEEENSSLLDAPNSETPETQTQEPPQEFVSRVEFEEWQRDYDAQQQQRLAEVERKAQAKADKARDNAIRKANAFEKDYASAMNAAGVKLDAGQVDAVKRNIIEREFWQETPNETNNGNEAQAQAISQPQVRIVSRDEIVKYLNTEALTEADVDVSRYAGLPSNMAGAREALLAEVQAAWRRRAQRPSDAQRVVQQFGGTTTPTRDGGQVYDAEKEMERLLALDVSAYAGGTAAYEARMSQLEKELVKAGKWK